MFLFSQIYCIREDSENRTLAKITTYTVYQRLHMPYEKGLKKHDDTKGVIRSR